MNAYGNSTRFDSIMEDHLQASGKTGRGRRVRKTTAADDDRRAGRTQVFEKTKFCKFFLQGQCQRGEQCRFAHAANELQQLPDLQRTKLCKVMLQTGSCDDPQCTYAHSRQEFRVVEGFSQDCGNDKPAVAEPQALRQDADGSKSRSKKGEQSSQTLKLGQQGMLLPGPGQFQNSAAAGQTFGAGPAAIPAAFFMPGFVAGGEADASAAERQQRVVMQMGSVAQAHAAEALRLQAMAAILQAQANAAHVANAGSGVPESGMAQLPVQPGFQDTWITGNASGGKSIPEQQSIGGGLRNYPAQEDSIQAGVPAQISLGSLRSLSSNSLPVQRDEDDELQMLGSGLGQLSQSQSQVLKVKNTFIDFDSDAPPLASRLRPICSASGRLDALGEEPEASEPPFQVPSVSVETPQHLADQTVFQMPIPQTGSLGTSVCVKNTFLDFVSEEQPKMGLRAVRTAQGRLDHLGEENSDMSDDM